MKMIFLHSQDGFTFIELMIVTFIIGIISSIALTQYSDFIAKTQHTAALADISSGKVMMETFFNNGININNNPIILGLQTSTLHCSEITANSNVLTKTATITCKIKGDSKVLNKLITWTRAETGIWTCTSTSLAKYSGKTCQGI